MTKIKKLLSLSMILLFSIVLVSCGSKKENDNNSNDVKVPIQSAPPRDEVTGELKVHYLNLDSAECILISQGEEYMLIDAGNEENEATLKNYFDNLGIKKFKKVIVSHPHNNHIGSMDYILSSYEVEDFYMPQVSTTTKAYENLNKVITTKSIKVNYPIVGDSFSLGQAKCTIIAPNSSYYEDLNDYSIVLKIEFGDNSFLFTGDAEGISESEMLLNKFDVKSDVLKISNSGSKSATSKQFLKSVDPKYAVISVGKGNQYGYPHDETLNKLNENNIETYRTDENGTIIATSNGKDITFTTKIK